MANKTLKLGEPGSLSDKNFLFVCFQQKPFAWYKLQPPALTAKNLMHILIFNKIFIYLEVWGVREKKRGKEKAGGEREKDLLFSGSLPSFLRQPVRGMLNLVTWKSTQECCQEAKHLHHLLLLSRDIGRKLNQK